MSLIKTIILIAALLTCLYSQQLTFYIQVKSNSALLFESNIKVQYNLYNNLQIPSVHFQVPKALLSKSHIEVSLLDPTDGRFIQQQSYKLTKKMFPQRYHFGLQKWFGIDNIVISNEIDIEEVYSQAIHLKIGIPNGIRANSKLIAFTIDQSLILNYKQFKPLSSVTSETVRLYVIPSFFEDMLNLFSDTYVQGSKFHSSFQSYFMSSRNKKIGEEDINMMWQLHRLNKNKSQQLIKELKNFSQKERQQLRSILKNQWQNIKVMEQNLKGVQQIIREPSVSHILTLYKNTVLNIFFQLLQIAKHALFFNYYQYYKSVFPLAIGSICLSTVAKYVFLLLIVSEKFRSYQDHIGLTLLPCYLILTSQLIKSLGNESSSYDCITIMLFLEPILRLQFEKIPSFPYFQKKTHHRYKQINEYDFAIYIKIGLLFLALLIGNYFFFARKVKYNSEKSLQKFNAFEIIGILLNDYLYFFIALGQIQINNQLQSVRHLTKGFNIAYAIIAISNNYLAFIYTQPLYILFILKEDILAGILIWQSLKWGDIGKGTRKHFLQKFMDEELVKRQAQLASLR